MLDWVQHWNFLEAAAWFERAAKGSREVSLELKRQPKLGLDLGLEQVSLKHWADALSPLMEELWAAEGMSQVRRLVLLRD